MKGFFGYEGGFFTVMDKVGSLFWLNVLCIVCCIPVFTIGASVTSLYYVTLKMVRDEECYITKDFFKSFRLNSRQATIIWLIFLAVGLAFYGDYRILQNYEKWGINVTLGGIVTVVLGAMMIIYSMMLAYVFPLLSKFDNRIKNTIKNSLLLSIRHLPWTAVILLCDALVPVAIVTVILTGKGVWVIPVICCIGFSGAAFAASVVFVKIFDRYIEGNETPEE